MLDKTNKGVKTFYLPVRATSGVLVTLGFLWLPACQIQPEQNFADPISTSTAISGEVRDSWRIKLTVTGGFKGINREIELSSSGNLVVTDEESGSRIVLVLSREEIAELDRQISGFGRLGGGSLPACADCFEYQLELEKGGDLSSVAFNDINLDSSAYGGIINALISLGNRAEKN